jgi:hypothetical protein
VSILDEIGNVSTATSRRSENPIADLLGVSRPGEQSIVRSHALRPEPYGDFNVGGGELGRISMPKPEGFDDTEQPSPYNALSAAKVLGTAAMGLASMPVSGLTGLGVGTLAQIDRLRGKDVDPFIEANRAVEATSARGNLITTPTEQEALEQAMLVMKPFQMAGEGLQEIVRQTPLKGTIAEPIAGTIGEVSAVFGTGGVGRTAGRMVKSLKDSTWYREMTIPERGLVVKSLDDMTALGMSEGEILKRWNNPQWRQEALARRMQGEMPATREPSFTRTPDSGRALTTEGKFTAEGTGELRPRPGEVRDILAEIGQERPKRLTAGQGFELRPRPDEIRDILAEMGKLPPALPYPEGVGEDFTSKPGETEAPIVTKAGDPFKTKKTAIAAVEKQGLDWNLYEVTPQEGGGFAITRKMGRKIRPEDAPVTETPILPTEPAATVKAEPAPVIETAPEIDQPGATAGGSLSYTPQAKAKLDSQAKKYFIDTLDKQLEGTGVSSKVYHDATFSFGEAKTDSIKASISSPETVKVWEEKITNGERPTILTSNQGGNITVVDGAHKLQAYKNLGIEDVPTVHAELKPATSGKTGNLLSNERGSIPIKESEVLQAILKARGKIKEALPHLEALGRSVYEGGKQRFLDWQAHMKTKLGDLWESFKAHMKDLWERVSKPLRNEAGATTILSDATKEVKGVLSETRKTADEYLGAISTRLGNINPGIKNTLRAFEFRRGMKANAATRRVLPFIEKVDKMNKEDRAAFDLARKNGDPAALKAMVIKHSLGKEYHALRDVLADLHKEAKDVGYDVGYLPNYHPRVLKDSKGFLEYFYKQGDWPILEQAIRNKEAELQRYLNEDEKAKLINYMLRGYQSGNISLSKPGQLKSRAVDKITPEINEFYMDSDGALLRYINDVTDAVEARKLFGKGKTGKMGNLEDTIGGYVLRLLQEGKIKPEQEQVLKDILAARFNEVGTRGIFGLYKNLSYIDTMGSPISAITQIGDVAWALYKSGIRNTVVATARAVVGKSRFKKEDIGIERIASEFADTSKMARAVDKTFTMIGLTKIDNIFKESLINSAYQAAKQKAMTDKGAVKLREELEPIFEGETEQLIKDLRAGNDIENARLYLFNVLSDFQPISLSEMPQKYLTGGNGRIFYMLKTFTLKQFDAFRREAFQKIGTEGQRIQGLKNLVRLAACFAAANATSDVIKDLILGRPIDPGDKVVDNLLRLVGISKFVTWQARTQGVGKAVVMQVAPPFKGIDALVKDINSAGDDKGLEIVQSIPLVGKLYYWWFGKGADKAERNENKMGRLVEPKSTLKGLK